MSAGVDIRVDQVGVQHLTTSGVVRALDDVTLDVAAGTSLAVVGPSGCGKSTLLGLLGGLALPTTGTVRVGADVISSMNDQQRAAFRRRTVGFVWQDDNLLPFLTVAENLALQSALVPDHRGDGSGVPELMSRLGLDDEADRLPDQLSGGQRQRVGIARAVAHAPALLLADEPTGALDPRNVAVVIDLLLDVSRQLGATLIVVTHDPAVAGRMDRRVGLHDGTLITNLAGRHARLAGRHAR
jgi:putative ABC transport system ATP-binding protein